MSGMRLNDGGYSRVQYTPAELRKVARDVAEYLPNLMRELDADTVVVTGKSGIAMAFAVSMLIDLPLCVVRKRKENTHGNPIEGKNGHIVRRYIILDDFVSSGETVQNIIDLIEERAELCACAGATQCVGVLQYLRGCYAKYVRGVPLYGCYREQPVV